MGRALVVIKTDADRARVSAWAGKAPEGTRVEFKAAKRTLDQNSMLWSMLTDIARAIPWHGMKLSPDDWKLIFMDALNRELRIVPNLDGDGFVNLGTRTSDLSKEEMGGLLDLIMEFGARRGVQFIDQRGWE